MGLDNCIQIISKQEIDFKDIPDYVYIKKAKEMNLICLMYLVILVMRLMNLLRK